MVDIINSLMQNLDRDIERVKTWLEEIKDGAGRFVIVFHGDCDGLVSAVLFDYILRQHLGKTDIEYIPVRTEQYDFEHVREAVEEWQPDVTVFLDLSIQNHRRMLKELAGFTRHAVLIYDHHSQENSDVPDNTLYLNPSITPDGFDDNSPPPCLFAAALARDLTGGDYDWAAAIGLIAESSVATFLPIFKKIQEQYPELCRGDKIETGEEVYNWRFKMITYALAAAFWGPPGEYEDLAFEVLSEMVDQNRPQFFFDRENSGAKALLALEKRVHGEINRLAAEVEYHSYYDSETGLRYGEVESELRIGGVVATRLAHRHDRDIIVTGQVYSDRYVIEARRGSRRAVNVAELLRKAANEINPYSVGGHPAAAGASLRVEESPEFFMELEKIIAGIV